MTRRRPMTHRIAAVTFEPGTNDGPCDCDCAKWSGLASEHAEHRKAVGARTNGRALGPTQPAPAHVVASRQRQRRRKAA